MQTTNNIHQINTVIGPIQATYYHQNSVKLELPPDFKAIVNRVELKGSVWLKRNPDTEAWFADSHMLSRKTHLQEVSRPTREKLIDIITAVWIKFLDRNPKLQLERVRDDLRISIEHRESQIKTNLEQIATLQTSNHTAELEILALHRRQRDLSIRQFLK